MNPWIRKNGDFSLTVSSGFDRDGTPYSIPYGSCIITPDHQLAEKWLRNHGKVPSLGGETRGFYLILGPRELSLAYRYTTLPFLFLNLGFAHRVGHCRPRCVIDGVPTPPMGASAAVGADTMSKTEQAPCLPARYPTRSPPWAPQSCQDSSRSRRAQQGAKTSRTTSASTSPVHRGGNPDQRAAVRVPGITDP